MDRLGRAEFANLKTAILGDLDNIGSALEGCTNTYQRKKLEKQATTKVRALAKLFILDQDIKKIDSKEKKLVAHENSKSTDPAAQKTSKKLDNLIGNRTALETEYNLLAGKAIEPIEE